MMKNNRLFCLFLLFCVLFSLFSCTATVKDAGEAPYTFTDDAGNSISLPGKPEKTAVLFSSFADIWTLAGGEISVTVGETIERGFALPGTPVVDDGAGKTINTELLIASKPDFVICSADVPAQADTATLLNASGITAALFRVESFTDYLRVLRIFTEITGNPDAYTQYGSSVQAEIEAMLTDYPPENTPPKRILFLRAGSSAKSTKAKTSTDHFAAGMLRELGAVNIADEVPVLLDGLSIEEILKQNPDAIFITTMGDPAAAQAFMDSLLTEETWQSLNAIKNNRYYYLPKELFQYKPNAGWSDAYAYLVSLLYEE